jgi:ATP-dependent Clp protease ATP-binding subunit ClpC
MTSNLGTADFQRQAIGFARGEELGESNMRRSIESELKRTFRPELLNRIDDVVIFRPLKEEHLRKIVDLMLRTTAGLLADRRVSLEVDDEAKAWLVHAGYDPVYGARPLRRVIEKHVENPLSSRLLGGEIKEGDRVTVTVRDGALKFDSVAA